MSQTPHGVHASTSSEDFQIRNETYSSQEANAGFVQQLQQVLGSDSTLNSVSMSGVNTMAALSGTQQMESIMAMPLLMAESVPGLNVKSEGMLSEKRRASTSSENLTEEDRLKRRREINRNSQRRIRERRSKEIEELRSETTRFRHENDQILRQIERINAEKTELLRQVQEITEKWQRAIAENAILNRENIQLRKAVQEDTSHEENNIIRQHKDTRNATNTTASTINSDKP